MRGEFPRGVYVTLKSRLIGQYAMRYAGSGSHLLLVGCASLNSVAQSIWGILSFGTSKFKRTCLVACRFDEMEMRRNEKSGDLVANHTIACEYKGWILGFDILEIS